MPNSPLISSIYECYIYNTISTTIEMMNKTFQLDMIVLV